MTNAQYEKALEELEDDMENGYITKEEYRRYLRELDEEYEASNQ